MGPAKLPCYKRVLLYPTLYNEVPLYKVDLFQHFIIHAVARKCERWLEKRQLLPKLLCLLVFRAMYDGIHSSKN